MYKSSLKQKQDDDIVSQLLDSSDKQHILSYTFRTVVYTRDFSLQ